MKNIILLSLVLMLGASSVYAKGADQDQVFQWFVKAQCKNGLVASGEGRNYCFTYDEALSAMVFTLFNDLPRAEKVLDFYVKQRAEQELCGKFIGFADMYEKYGNIGGPSRAAGPNAWVLLAINYYTHKTRNTKYMPLALALADWLFSLEGADGGISGGYDERSRPFGWISTEHNLDCYSAFRDLWLLTGEQRFLHMARRILFYLENFLWYEEEKRFYNGAMDANYATDVSSWAVSSLGKSYSRTLDFALKKSLNTEKYEKNDLFVTGFDFGSPYWESHYPDKDSVWLEGTGQMALAFHIAGRDKEKALYLMEMEKTITPSDVYQGTKGLPYATNPGTPAGSGWIMGPEPLCVSSAAWYLFALLDFNPFSIEDLEKSNKKIREMKEQINFQQVPVIDDFDQGEIKILTAYPLALHMKSDAKVELFSTSDAAGGKGALRIHFAPGREYDFQHAKYWSARETASAWAVFKRKFFQVQDWSGFDGLSFFLKCDGAPLRFRIKFMDKDNETWQTREIITDNPEWKKFDFKFKNDLSVDGEAPVKNGNNHPDLESIKQIMFFMKQGKGSYESDIYLDELKLERSLGQGK